MEKYDSILYIEPELINEVERMNGTDNPEWSVGFKNVIPGLPYNVDDPKMYNAFTFGRMVKSAIDSWGSGWSSEVSDFKKWVVVRVKYHDYNTSRSATKTFLIVFQLEGDGIVLSTHNRYRSISGTQQAISYIKSACSALKNSTQTRI